MNKKKFDIRNLGIPNVCFSIAEENDKICAEQRKTRGFDDSELWNLDSTFIAFALPRLKAFKESHAGWPADLSGMEEWDKKLQSMIDWMELYKEDALLECETEEERKSIEKKMDEGKKAFFDFFEALWS